MPRAGVAKLAQLCPLHVSPLGEASRTSLLEGPMPDFCLVEQRWLCLPKQLRNGSDEALREMRRGVMVAARIYRMRRDALRRDRPSSLRGGQVDAERAADVVEAGDLDVIAL